MKGIRNILLLLLFSLLLSGVAFYDAQPDGTTTESREAILNNLDVHEGMTWRIRTEIPLGDKMICSIYSEYKKGIAVFEKQENGRYKWQSCSYLHRDQEGGLRDSVYTDGNWYDFYFLDNIEAVVFKCSYESMNTHEVKDYQYDVSNTDLVYCPDPEYKDFIIHFNWYDADGNALFD